MQHTVIGTAGHIDHGKSALVRALTGTDPDRLEEERRRGITVDLGFAHRTLPDATLSFVDVPGHERFVRSMVAGATGIDVALFVIAADEGVMPQTREHLDILGLLGVEAGVIALTKADLLPSLGEEWGPLLDADVDELLAGTALEGARRIYVSSKTGAGLDDLAEALQEAAARAPKRAATGPLFLPVDRSFPIRGFGTVATGTLHAGTLAVGDEVALLPGGPAGVRVRGLQSHGEDERRVLAGQRAAINLAGVAADEVERGMVLVHSGQVPESLMLDVELQLLEAAPRPLRSRSKLLLHLGTAQTTATVVLLDRRELLPGERAFAQLRLGTPLAALPSQRFLLRGPASLQGRGRTLAGGGILAIASSKQRAGMAATRRLQRLRHGSDEERVVQLLSDAGAGGLDKQGLCVRAGLSVQQVERHLQRLGARGAATCFDRERDRWVAGALLGSLAAKARLAVAAYHQAHPLAPGLPTEELRRRLDLGDKLLARLLPRLEEAGLVVTRDALREAGHRPGSDTTDQALEAKILSAIASEGLSPPEVGELAAKVGASQERVVAILRLLAERGAVVRVAPHLYVEAGALHTLQRRLVAFLLERGRISTQDFKDMTRTTRKWLIPLGSHFDAEKVTLRVGTAERTLRGDPETWTAWLGQQRGSG